MPSRSLLILRTLGLAMLLADAVGAYPLVPELETSDGADSAFSVSLRAGASGSSAGDRQAFGLVTLTLALDRLAQGPALLTATTPDADDDGEGIAEASPAATDGASATRMPERPPAPVVREAVSPALARAAVDAALRVRGSARRLERIEDMASRARTRAALPELGLRAGTSSDATLRLTPIASDPARFTQSGGRDLWFEARLTWKLDRALFSADEVAIERLTWNSEEVRERVVRRVLELLFDWQQAQLTLVEPLLADEQYRKAWLSALRSAAELDVLTDGWFSRRLGVQ
jgi:hypothetical protein